MPKRSSTETARRRRGDPFAAGLTFGNRKCGTSTVEG
jgi:hypothetical protein